MRRCLVQYKRSKYTDRWPIDSHSTKPPRGWLGWPGGKKFAFILSHDVDTRKGYDNVLRLAELEEQMGFRSQFNFVPERYGEIRMDLLDKLKRRGFGVGVHGLYHDGKLFESKKIFAKNAIKINDYLKQWDSKSFSAPSMIRNHAWMHEHLDVDFCISTFDTDPFEPQPEGAGTIYPYWVQNDFSKRPFLELPYTIVQDFTLFLLLGEKSVDIWRQKLDWIASRGGMALLNTHPDYMNFRNSPNGLEEYPSSLFCDFLKYTLRRYKESYWHALPSQVHDLFRSSYGNFMHAASNSAPSPLTMANDL